MSGQEGEDKPVHTSLLQPNRAARCPALWYISPPERRPGAGPKSPHSVFINHSKGFQAYVAFWGYSATTRKG